MPTADWQRAASFGIDAEQKLFGLAPDKVGSNMEIVGSG